jgi:hypothetical protein
MLKGKQLDTLYRTLLSFSYFQNGTSTNGQSFERAWAFNRHFFPFTLNHHFFFKKASPKSMKKTDFIFIK